MSTIKGFSKLSKNEKLQWIAHNFFKDAEKVEAEIQQFTHPDESLQKILDGFSENTIANFPMPYGIAPNFVINGKIYAVPMVIEESSVVAAASSAAKFWMERGGFHATVLTTKKIGQVHFTWNGDGSLLKSLFPTIKSKLIQDTKPLTARMEKRGGGILDIELLDFTSVESHYFQIRASFETCDSMGANFINSVLEQFAQTLSSYATQHDSLKQHELNIIMAILSNYTPDCLVRASVSCPVADLEGACKELSGEQFAEKFYKAVRIAEIDPYRATTHNKGIYNGIDAVVLATANDFRAIEACGHTYAAHKGQYASLSYCSIENDKFRFWLEVPMAVGTVGGLTKLHPLAKRSLQLLGNPSAEELMQVIAAVGLAQNFAALRSLITTGIQKGHMKMHLQNILNHLGAKANEIEASVDYFANKTVSYTDVRNYLDVLRAKKQLNGHHFK